MFKSKFFRLFLVSSFLAAIFTISSVNDVEGAAFFKKIKQFGKQVKHKFKGG